MNNREKALQAYRKKNLTPSQELEKKIKWWLDKKVTITFETKNGVVFATLEDIPELEIYLWENSVLIKKTGDKPNVLKDTLLVGWESLGEVLICLDSLKTLEEL